jgi:hypothetical protein
MLVGTVRATTLLLPYFVHSAAASYRTFAKSNHGSRSGRSGEEEEEEEEKELD